jgi:hypothetical protein
MEANTSFTTTQENPMTTNGAVATATRIYEAVAHANPGETVICRSETEWRAAREAHRIGCPTKLIKVRWLDASGNVLLSDDLGQIVV